MNNMNKILCAVIISAVILSAVAGCGNKDTQVDNIDTSDTTYVAQDESYSPESSVSSLKTVSEVSDEKIDKTVLYTTGAKAVPFSSEGAEMYQTTSQLAPGTEVETEQKDLSAEYICVYNPQDKTNGYIKSIYLVANKSAVTSGETLVVSAESADLYSGEGGSGDVVKTLVQGEEVSVLAKTSGGYWKVKTTDDTAGYVNLENVVASESDDVDSVGNSSSINDVNSNSTTSNTSTTKTQIYTIENTVIDGTASSNDNAEGNLSDSSPTDYTSTNNSQSVGVTDFSTFTDGGSTDFNSAVSKAQNSVGGNWAAALVELDSGEQQSFNDSQMQAASLIKLYIMGAIYERYDTYILQDSDIDSYLYSMITVSDNTAANNLVRILGSGNTDAGRSVVTAYCQSHGYGSTSMGRLLLESTINGDNYTSVGDCARFLTDVYNSELPHSAEMLSLLKQQTRTSKIPAGVPVQTANKTGELDLVQNDAAIVFAERPYVLCVMSENVSAGSAVAAIVELSSEVYDMVNN